MMPRFKTLLAVTALALPLALAAGPAPAQSAAPQLSQEAQADLARVQAYLNEIRTLRSSFLQVANDGGVASGTFYLSRPGRMRIEYDPPLKNFIVADGRFVYFWDAELEQQSNAPIGSTLADFLLRENISLSGDVTVTDVRNEDEVLEVSLVQSSDPGLGQLTLVFEDRPLRLRKWRVLDAQGLTTEVALQDPQTGVELDRNLFYFRDPTRRRERD